MHAHDAGLKQITVRNLDDQAVRRAKERAQKKGISVNRVYCELIEKGVGLDSPPQRFNDLDQFAGDSDFGPGWEEILEKDLGRIDEREWQ